MLDLWALAIYDLKITEQLFLKLTMKELDVLCKRKQINDRRIEGYSAQISWLIYSFHRTKKMPERTIDDFMSQSDKPKRKQSTEEMKNMAKLITKALNGVIK